MLPETSQVRLYFIRHAESEINAAGINIGGQSLSCVLSPLGNKQAILLGKARQHLHIYFFLYLMYFVQYRQTFRISKYKIRLYSMFNSCPCQTNSRNCIKTYEY